MASDKFPMRDFPPLDSNAAFNFEAFMYLLCDITPLPEPQVAPIPVAKIKYSHEFDYFLSYFRGFCKCDYDNFVSAEAASPRALMLLAYVVKYSAANYTAWKYRRDFVLDAERFRRSVRQKLDCMVPVNPPTYGKGPEEGCEMQKKTFENLTEKELAVVETWCPDADRDLLEDGSYSPWRAVRWELRTSEWFLFKNQKNFQTWSHRKELIATACAMAGDRGYSSTTMELDGVPFSTFDERTLCNAVIDEDSKNYHAWSHRSWFLGQFPFLKAPEGDVCSPAAVASAKETISSVHVGSSSSSCGGSYAVPVLDNETIEKLAEGLQCGGELQNELDFTTELIRADVFNNSAWSHRMLMIQHFVELLSPQLEGDQTLSAFAVFEAAIAKELGHALAAAIYEPTNESPYTFMIALAELFASIVTKFGVPGQSPLKWLLALVDTFDAVLSPRINVVRKDIDKRLAEPKPDRKMLKKDMPYRPTLYLKHNCHRVDAATFHALFRSLRITAMLQNANSAEGGVSVDEAVVSAMETKAKKTAAGLAVSDPIRAKYWEHEHRIIYEQKYGSE